MSARGLPAPMYECITRIEGDKGRPVQIPYAKPGKKGRLFYHDFKPASKVRAYALGRGRHVLSLPRRGVLLLGAHDIWANADGS